jgi:NAD(P)-dependent dehydrogenase (short-subunit alcohol dehydrogenase family)
MAHSVLITGAARGFGRSLTRTFARNGWRVFALLRKASDAEELIQNLGACCVPLVADLRNPVVEEVIASGIAANGAVLDVLINNAGIPGESTHLDSRVVEEVSDLLDVHCLGALRCTKACVSFLKRSPNPVVVNISSRLGSITKTSNGDFLGEEHSYAYRVAKAAQNMVSACMATDAALQPIKIISVHPGRMQTDLGGSDAPISPDKSAERLFRFITTTDVPLGGFFDLFDGQIPW